MGVAHPFLTILDVIDPDRRLLYQARADFVSVTHQFRSRIGRHVAHLNGPVERRHLGGF